MGLSVFNKQKVRQAKADMLAEIAWPLKSYTMLLLINCEVHTENIQSFIV